MIDVEDASGNVLEGFLRIERNPRASDHISLRREADIAARLDHPNICSLMGVAADAE